MRLLFRPLVEWPGARYRDEHRIESPFSAGWSDTLDVLDREVHAIKASGSVAEVILQVDAPERAMRLDGGIRADAKVNSPGVIVSFESRHGPLTYACDRFRTSTYKRKNLPGWQANVRAIALGLEALRKVDRYGIAQSGEQYRGWSALPPARPMGPAMTVEDAVFVLVDLSGRTAAQVTADPHGAWRRAARSHHPDGGGDPATFRRLTEARDILLGEAS